MTTPIGNEAANEKSAESRPSQASTTTSAIGCRNLTLMPDPGRKRLRLEIPRVRERIPQALASAMRSCTDGDSPWPLFAHGPAGVGKTCAALYLCDRVPGHSRFTDFGVFVREVRDVDFGRLVWRGTHADTRPTEHEYWSVWSMWSLCVIDELGAREQVSDHAYDAAKRAIDVRYRKPLILLSNIGLPEIAKLYDDRIASRLAEGTVVCVDGFDQRLRGR